MLISRLRDSGAQIILCCVFRSARCSEPVDTGFGSRVPRHHDLATERLGAVAARRCVPGHALPGWLTERCHGSRPAHIRIALFFTVLEAIVGFCREVGVDRRGQHPFGHEGTAQPTRRTAGPARMARGISATWSTTSSRRASLSAGAPELTWTE